MKRFGLLLCMFVLVLSGCGAPTVEPYPPPSEPPVKLLAVSRVAITSNGTVYDCADGEIKGVTVKAENVIVRNCNIIDAVGTGIEVHGKNNRFENIVIDGVTISNGDVDGIRFFGSGHVFINVIVKNIHCVAPAHCDATQTWGDSGHVAAFNILFDHVEFHNWVFYYVNGVISKGQCGMWESGSPSTNVAHDITIKNSVLDCMRGINIGDSDDQGTSHHIYILNNTFVGRYPNPANVGDNNGIYFVFVTEGSNVVVRNNIILNPTTPFIGSMTADHNLIYRQDGKSISGCGSSDLCGVNPQLVDMAGGDYRLQSTSPARGRGYDGSDLGGYQFDGDVSTATVAPTGVGSATSTASRVPTITKTSTATSTRTVTPSRTPTMTATTTATEVPPILVPTMTPTAVACVPGFSDVDIQDVEISTYQDQTLRTRSAPSVDSEVIGLVFSHSHHDIVSLWTNADCTDYWGGIGDIDWFALKIGTVYFVTPETWERIAR